MPKASSTASAWGENSIDASPAPAGFSTDDPLSTRSLVAGDPSALHLLTTTLHGSPLRGDLWLRLAAVSVETDRSSYDTAGLLKMSYYTAPNDLELFPLRLSVALSRDALVRNIELRDLIKRDIEVILTRQRALTPALMAAYRSASADGKIFAENLMAALDVDHSQQKQMPHEELGER
jgi:hypothetical protein